MQCVLAVLCVIAFAQTLQKISTLCISKFTKKHARTDETVPSAAYQLLETTAGKAGRETAGLSLGAGDQTVVCTASSSARDLLLPISSNTCIKALLAEQRPDSSSSFGNDCECIVYLRCTSASLLF